MQIFLLRIEAKRWILVLFVYELLTTTMQKNRFGLEYVVGNLPNYSQPPHTRRKYVGKTCLLNSLNVHYTRTRLSHLPYTGSRLTIKMTAMQYSW